VGVNRIRDTPEFQRGRSGEQIVAKWLQDRGWYVVPSYDYSGADDHPPRMQGADAAYVIPDLDIAKDGRRLWVEVKTKTAATFTRMTQQLEHGISLRHFEHYQAIQRITGSHVWLFVIEEDCAVLLAESLDALSQRKRVYAGGKMGRAGMVFFPRDRFRTVIQLRDLPNGERAA
jgi:hypothetical protein